MAQAVLSQGRSPTDTVRGGRESLLLRTFIHWCGVARLRDNIIITAISINFTLPCWHDHWKPQRAKWGFPHAPLSSGLLFGLQKSNSQKACESSSLVYLSWVRGRRYQSNILTSLSDWPGFGTGEWDNWRSTTTTRFACNGILTGNFVTVFQVSIHPTLTSK